MKKTRHGVFILFFVLLLNSCSNFIPFQNLNTLNELYTTAASIQSHSITSFYTTDKSGTVCIPSGVQTSVQLTIVNPYPLELSMTPASSAVCTEGPVISGIGDDLTQAELVFTLDSSEELKYADFTITVQTEDLLRTFGTYTVSVFCNSMPSEAEHIAKSFSADLNRCVFYGNLPAGPVNTDITAAEITYFETGTENPAGTVSINPGDPQYKQRPSGIPSSFVHSDSSFYYYVEDSSADYDWGITLIDSAGLRSASVFTTPLLLSVLPPVTAGEESGTYYTDDPEEGYPVEFTSSTEGSVIEFRTKKEGEEFGDWETSEASVFTHNFPVGVTVIELRSYKQTFPYSPVAEYTYTIIPQTVVGITLPDIANSDVHITLTAENPADSSAIALTDGSFIVPSEAGGIRFTAAAEPEAVYTYTWTLFNADGSENTSASSAVSGNTAVVTGIPSGFYSLIVIAEDEEGNTGMTFVPLYTGY